MTETNVRHLLLATDLLAAAELEQKCLKFLCEKLTVTNCMKRFQLVSCGESGQPLNHKWKRAYNKILLFIQLYFYKLLKVTQLYGCTTFAQFKTIIKGECLTVDCEDFVYESVKLWIKYHGVKGQKAYELMQEVQWPLIIDMDRISKDCRENLGENFDHNFHQILQQAIDYHGMRNEDKLHFWKSKKGHCALTSSKNKAYAAFFLSLFSLGKTTAITMQK